MKYEVKLTMEGKIPSGIEIFEFPVSEQMFNEIFDTLTRIKNWKKNIVII